MMQLALMRLDFMYGNTLSVYQCCSLFVFSITIKPDFFDWYPKEACDLSALLQNKTITSEKILSTL